MLALQTNELTGRLDEVGSRLSEFQALVGPRLEHLDAGLKHLESRFDDIESRFDHLEVRFDHLEVRFETIEARFETLETRFETIEARLDHLAAGQIKIRAEIMDRIDRLQGTVELIREDSRVNWATADTAITRVRNSREEIENLLTTVAAMERRHQLLTAIVDGLRNPGANKPGGGT